MAITQLVFDFFDLCQLSPIQIRHGVWQVQIDEALMKELDGWRAQARLLQFTFEKGKAEAFGADLIAPGSYRFNSILGVICKQGILSQAHLPHEVFHEPNIRKRVLQNIGLQKKAYVLNNAIHYSQYLILDIKVTQLGLDKDEWIHTAFVNLSTGEVLKFAPPAHLIQGGAIVGSTIRKRKCSFKKAYEQVCEVIKKEVMKKDQAWVDQAWEKFKLEQEQLNTYFEGTSAPQYQPKLRELENRLAPKIQMDAIRGAILYVPAFFYRLVVVEPTGKEKNQNIYYDPVNNCEELE